jgi:hypothetical protein
VQRAVGRASGPQPALPGPPTGALGRVTWPAVDGATYTLQHRNASGVWRTVASGVPAAALDLFQPEATWDYRVRAEDGPWSDPSPPLVVDRTPPAAPTVPGEWFRDSATVALTALDPPLPDGSPGSGVEPAAPQTFTSTAVLRGTVRDRAGNVSPEGGGEVRVDAAPPRIALSCPSTIVRGSGALGRWTASDEASGLATPAAGAVPLGRGGVARVVARDVVGHEAGASCRYRVVLPLRLWTTAARVRDGVVRLRLTCRRGAARDCRTILVLRRGRVRAGRSRLVTIPRGVTRTVRARVRLAGRLGVFASGERLGVVQTRRSSIQRDAASRRSTL